MAAPGPAPGGAWRALDALAAALLHASAAAMGAILAALVALDVAQVVLRYGAGRGWPWAGDLSVILLLTLAWIGAGHLWLARGHIAVDLIAPASRAGRALWLAFDAAVLAGGIALWPMTLRTMAAYGFIDLPALPLAASAKYLPVAAGTAFAALAAAILLVRRAGPPPAPPPAGPAR